MIFLNLLREKYIMFYEAAQIVNPNNVAIKGTDFRDGCNDSDLNK